MSILAATVTQGQLVITPEPGYSILWNGNDGEFFNPASPAPVGDNLALAANGATPISSSDLGPELGIGFHRAVNLTDGLYGNSNSWISASTDPGPNAFAGVLFGASTEVSVIAFGRDNGNNATDACGGQCTDRSLGIYVLQFTTDGTSWTSIGTLNYQGNEDAAPGGGFTAYLRHAFAVSTDLGAPISATGIRILVPVAGLGGGTAIDEIEAFSGGIAPPTLFPVEEGGGADAAANLAATGTAFAKDAAPGRIAGNLNDGLYGDGSAWVGSSPDNFAGIGFGADSTLASVAFGRDNTGVLTDRTLGSYLVQITNSASPDESTPDVEWTTIGMVVLAEGIPANPSRRHRFNFPAVSATGLRLVTPDGAAIDELEAYAAPYVPPVPPALAITPSAGFEVSWDGNDGDFFDGNPPPDGAKAPDNLALATNGGVSFGSSELGPELGIGFHLIANLNDGVYGNSNSWISASADPGPKAFAGIAFATPTAIERIAWGRDNGNGAVDNSSPGTDACGGQCTDRSLGIYTLQVTSVPNPGATTPDADWTTVATLNYRERRDALIGEEFTEFLRHEFMVSQGGAPLMATGIRILVPGSGLGGGTAIDEIEVYGARAPTREFAILDFERDPASGEVTLTFVSVPGAFYALDISPNLEVSQWMEIDDAIVGAPAATTTTVTNSFVPLGAPQQLYRIRKF